MSNIRIPTAPYTETCVREADITFTPVNDVPEILNNQIEIDEGGSVLLDSTMLSATDSDNTDDELSFNVINVLHGKFEKVSNPGVEVTTFTYDEVLGGEIKFIHDGGEEQPSYEISVTDGSLSSDYETVSVIFHPVNDTPQIGNNEITLSEGESLLITQSELSVIDPDNSTGDFIFTVRNVKNGRFEHINNPGSTITSFGYQEVLGRYIRFVHNGGELSPSYEIQVTDGTATSDWDTVVVHFTNVNDAPKLENMHFSIKRENQSKSLMK